MKLYRLIILLTSFFFMSCEEFEDMNQNPNEPTDVSTDVLFPSAIRQSMNTMVEESFLLGNNAAQLTSKTLRTEVDSYNWNAFPTVWEGLYESLTDISVVEQKAIEEGNTNLEGAAIVLKSWIFATLTNAYGDIPYFNAIDGGESNFTPEYDAQEDIYNDLLSELERAANLLATGEGSIGGDILLGGDASKWRKLANSLRLRLIMYASSQLTSAESEFAAIVTAGNIMTSNEDNATLSYLDAFPNQFPLIPLKTGDFDAVALSESALNVMSDYNDPRLARYARPDNDDYENPVFTGAVNGSNSASCSKAGSRLGVMYYNYPNLTTANDLGIGVADGILMTYSEVEFLLAEAAAKDWISDDVETHYQAGIEASMDYYEVTYDNFGWTNFDDYYANSGVAYSTVTDIWEQKWLSLYFTGLDPYFEVRRWYAESDMNWDGIPFLSPSCENLNNDNLPLKFLYPGEEQSLNAENYQAAIQKIGGSNSFNVSIWLVE
ncbi:SusD/RagB family nutrient-binding outer membrane lipoprotein [Chondrinema litorale]|uniref:SusD/RagB family nutrient-binding outer membrane lipoprotein n=1 Tax=Chondrinema litorale TaxID=2994555 RepID=UPI002543C889|nr:SusD/RagB family nutrient-binding outer membrane lipoprotein [Chondrinema litorale]UZR96355.1 SusD/RagB family nutrient-binding outer membrane lipoprotein [Chondrinema litorale]